MKFYESTVKVTTCLWNNPLGSSCKYGPVACQQCQVRHWRFKGLIKYKKEYNAADVSPDGF